MSHTPGPWEAAEKGAYSDFDGQSQVVLGDDRRLAVVHVSDDETAANAALIAAAPDLLEACKTVLPVIMECDPHTAKVYGAILRGAIRKAEGRGA